MFLKININMMILALIIAVLTAELNAQVITYPGTKWCGDGNNAESYDDLGEDVAADTCCRAHQNCEYIKAGETKHNLTNPGPFTRMACSCDAAFRTCLQAADTEAAKAVYTVYFIVLFNKLCFKEGNVCTKYECYFDTTPPFFHKKCIKEEFKYGWFLVSEN